MDTRTHNQANELVSQDIVTTGTDKLDFTYDNAGNARTQEVGSESAPTVITYTHDLWNRLVTVAYKPDGGSSVPRSVYTYNALNWRIMKQADLDYISETNPLDQERKMYYSANWQVLEERIDEDYIANPGVNRRMQYIWGPRYIDDIALRRLDGTADGDFTDGADKVYYHCTDVQFSTVAVVSDTAILLERVSYDPYGKARHHRPADMTGEGAVDTPDLNVVSANYGSIPAPGDVDRDGDVDVDDYIAVTLGWGTGIASGQLSLTDNVIGWDGYVFNPEMDGDGMYTVRFRHYRPGLGRWVERDPLWYIDSMCLFETMLSDPISNLDPEGTACTTLSCTVASLPPSTQPPFSISPGTKGCPQTIFQLIADPAVQGVLRRVAFACGCVPTITCKRCNFGGKAPPPVLDKCPKLILCLDKNGKFVSPDPRGTLIHELTHVRQWCEHGSRSILDFCEEVICMEHEAYEIEGECLSWGRRIDPKTGAPYRSMDDCLCKRACDSVSGAIVPCMLSVCHCRDKCMDLIAAGKCLGGHYVK
jgi:RHS repeat-associated protein